MYVLRQNSFFSVFLGGLVCAYASVASTYANSDSGPLPVAFDESQTQTFSLSLSLVDASIFVTGNGRVKDVCCFGADITWDLTNSSGQGQTKPLSLSGGTVGFNSAPDGSATLGFDHTNPNAPGQTISSLNVDFRNGADWGFAFNEITLDVDADVTGVTGSFDMGLKLRADLNQFSFAQDPGSTNMNSTGFFAPGAISAGIAGTVDARIKDILLGADLDFGEIADFNESVLDDFGLPASSATLTPQGAFPSGPFPQDLLAKLELDFPFALNFPINQTGTAVRGGDSSYNISYTIVGTLVLSNLAYSLEDIVSELGDFDDDDDADGFDFLKWQRGESVDPLGTYALADWEANFGAGGGALSGLVAGVPEPSTFLLAGLGISAMWARRRRWRRTPT